MPLLSLPNLCLVLLILCLYVYQRALKWQRFWVTRGVPLLDPIPFLGQREFAHIFTTSYFEIIHNLYQKAKGLKYCCIFQFSSPTLMFLDPQLIGNILTKDFEYFSDRFDLPYDEKHAISHQLFSVSSTKWKDLSKQISPVVSPGRISFLIQEMEANFDEISPASTVNIDQFAFTFNEKIVGTATLGTRLKSLTGNSCQILRLVKNLIDPSLLNFFRFYIPLIFPSFNFLSIPRINDADLCAFVKNIIPFRRKFESHRNDVFQFFVDTEAKLTKRKGSDSNKKSSSEEGGSGGSPNSTDFFEDGDTLNISRRLFWFLMDSQGTSTVALAFVLHVVSLHPECQEEIKQELERALKDRGESTVTYQVVRDLKYTHTVVKECLRLYTPMSVLQRVCTKDYQLPGSHITIPKGTKVIIPIYSIQRDERYFPDPLGFKPSRFNDLTQITPYTFMPFGEGPRFCIGYRFAMAHLKYTVASLVSKFRIEAVTSDQNVLSLHPFSPTLLRAGENILVRLKKRDITE